MKPIGYKTTRFHQGAAFGLLALGSLATASVIPVELPPQDVTPPAKDKPAKVYFLSADPAAKPAELPSGGVAFSAFIVGHEELRGGSTHEHSLWPLPPKQFLG
jgi:hypothetical protein